MQRRDFLRAGAQAAVAGVAGSAVVHAGPTASTATQAVPTVWKSFTADDHRRRLKNIGIYEREIRTCMRKHLVTSYLPGQCCYNLGEYPCRKPWDPGEYDERELDRLREHGIQLIQVFDDWSDSLRLFGGDKYTALNPDGFRRFIQMVHRRGMKMLTYTSTAFLQWTDPDFRPEWSPPGLRCSCGYWDMALCSPASPGWRAYLLPRLMRIMDEFDLDGIYVDGGYVTNAQKVSQPQSSPLRGSAKDAVPAFEETPQHDGAFADLLALVYAEVKRRGGILKLHVGGDLAPQTAGLTVYDYLWVGEGVNNADGLREAVKNHPPYVIPCIDMTFAKVENEDEQYLHAIPYLQFPVLQAGRPFTGERGMIPGVRYVSQDDFWMRRCRAAWKHYQANPNGPYTYGGWDAVPGRAETRPRHAYWLKRYLPLVEEGSWAWLEIGRSSLFDRPLPKGVVASAFANRELYVVLANYGQTAAEVHTAASYRRTGQAAGAAAKEWRLPPRSLEILCRAA
jgi:hypothetical protein